MSHGGNVHEEASRPQPLTCQIGGTLFGYPLAFAFDVDASLCLQVRKIDIPEVLPRPDDVAVLVVLASINGGLWQVRIWSSTSRRRDVLDLMGDGMHLLAGCPDVYGWAVVPAEPGYPSAFTVGPAELAHAERFMAWLSGLDDQVLHLAPDAV